MKRAMEIPRDEWMSFLEGFSQRHQGWLVTLEVVEPQASSKEQARDLPLEEITLNGPNERGTISIVVGNGDSKHLIYTVSAPARLWLEQTAEGADEALEIESTDHTRTSLRFRSAIPAEMVDGLL